MAKEDIFSKINLKDYNNLLENILEQKNFSEEVKNLLLSMLYKIENGYQDYKTVKVNVASRKYFLKKIVQIIEEKCKEIKLIKPLSEESKILEEKNVNYIVNKEEGKLIAYPNERILLEALVTLNQEDITLEEDYELFHIGIEEILQKGNKMNIAEVIRDFNGWSWDITTSQMESKNINIIYQNLLILLGNSFLQAWITKEEKQVEEEIDLPNNEILRSKYNDSFGITKEDMQEDKQIDYIQKMQEILSQKYGEEKAKSFLIQLIKTVLAIGCNQNQEQKEIILSRQKQIKQKLEKMQDNKKYLEDLSQKKKKITSNIKEIDTLLNEETLLKEEYEKRNKVLPNKEKIFSISHLKIMLEKQRQKHLEEMQECNKQMQPKEFVNTKKQLEEKMAFFQGIEIEEGKRTKEEKQINQLQVCFLNCFIEKIKNAETKNEIRNLVYELRYYEQIPYQEQTIRQIDLLKEQIEKAEKELIQKACKEKIINTFSQQDEANRKILENQFQSKIINLENTIYILKYHKGTLKIQIYDTNIEEETKEMQLTEKIELLVKLNKKIKVWL